MIKEFRWEYAWLSNFASVPILLDGIQYPSVEHAYLSAKSKDDAWKKLCASNISAGQVKQKSYSIIIRADWERIRLDVMRECLGQKFSQNPYKRLLICTGDEHIQEGNNWNDRFWGVCLKTNKGENNLGKLIMEIRATL